MASQPLVEVFGFPLNNQPTRAARHRKFRLCPYNNKIPNCTKDKANDPLGVCAVSDSNGNLAITCPVRFRQDWLIAEDAAGFFCPNNSFWTALTEVRLNDRNGISAGNIDIVLAPYDSHGGVLDFGALGVRAVYISGTVRTPFEAFIQNPQSSISSMEHNQTARPRPDYLSSSRKRLVPQLLYKGRILRAWGKKQAVALHRQFFATLPALTEIAPEEADIVWLVYDLELDEHRQEYQLKLYRTVYTLFAPSLNEIITPEPETVGDFVNHLQSKLAAKLETEQNPPDTFTLDELL